MKDTKSDLKHIQEEFTWLTLSYVLLIYSRLHSSRWAPHSISSLGLHNIREGREELLFPFDSWGNKPVEPMGHSYISHNNYRAEPGLQLLGQLGPLRSGFFPCPAPDTIAPAMGLP